MLPSHGGRGGGSRSTLLQSFPAPLSRLSPPPEPHPPPGTPPRSSSHAPPRGTGRNWQQDDGPPCSPCRPSPHCGNADGRAAIGHTVLELIDAARLVLPGQPLVVALPALSNVLRGHLAERVADLFDDLVAALLAHRGDREVRVAPRAVPIAIRWLGAEGHDHVVALRDTVHNVAGHRHVVPDLNATARADLVLPLAGHDLGVDPGDLHARLQALHEVLVRHRAADREPEARAAVVRALR